MLGIGGGLQSQLRHPLHDDRHRRNVQKIHDGDLADSAKGDGADGDGPSKKRKREEKQEEPSVEENEVDGTKTWIPLHEVIIKAKGKMQSHEKKNGVTFAFMGSSGCGKSTVICKVFIEKIFGKQATKTRPDEKEYIIQIFTMSAKSDAFKELPKDIIVDDKGLDEDNINFCYHMNENYDKKYNFFLMLDDCIDIRYKQLLQQMFLTMRNTNISSLVSLQYPKLIPVSIRTSVYFALFFFFNNDEATEQAVRGWLTAYLPGSNIQEKILYYREWVSQNEGHNMFLMDNLNHKCYKIDSTGEDYLTIEMPMITQEQKMAWEYQKKQSLLEGGYGQARLHGLQAKRSRVTAEPEEEEED